MRHKANIRTAREIQIPDLNISFVPTYPAPEPDEDVWVTEDPADGSGIDTVTVSWLIPDELDEFEWDDLSDPPARWSYGFFRDFRNSRDGGGEEARDSFYDECVEAVGVDHVFVVDVYSHGLDHFSVADTRDYPDRRWDVAPACILAVPPNVTNPVEWANGALNSYSSWVNGDVWAVCRERLAFTLSATLSSDCLGGFIGRENAENAAVNGY